MNRAPRITLALLATVAAPLCAQAAPAPDAAKRPNFVVMVADDLGFGDLGCYGNREIRTPRIDEMARGGTLFTHFYVSSPTCSPSRVSLMTGCYPQRFGIRFPFLGSKANRRRGMPDYLTADAPSLPRILRRNGYRTGHYGKWHLSSGSDEAPTPDELGFDEAILRSKWPGGSLGHPDRAHESSARVVDEAIGFVERNNDEPFYLQVWFSEPHVPLKPSAEQLARYESLAPDLAGFSSPRQIYSAVVSELDRQVGRFLDRLTELGLRESTLVVFLSDNGPEIDRTRRSTYCAAGSAWPFRGRKRSLYEGGIRVPFIASWPGRVPRGRIDRASVLAGQDLLPTVAALAGVELDPDTPLDGEDVTQNLRGEERARTAPLCWEWPDPSQYDEPIHHSPALAIRQGRWKLLVDPNSARQELYNVIRDPMEVDNRAAERPKVVGELQQKLREWIQEMPGYTPPPPRPVFLGVLQQLPEPPRKR